MAGMKSAVPGVGCSAGPSFGCSAGPGVGCSAVSGVGCSAGPGVGCSAGPVVHVDCTAGPSFLISVFTLTRSTKSKQPSSMLAYLLIVTHFGNISRSFLADRWHKEL